MNTEIMNFDEMAAVEGGGCAGAVVGSTLIFGALVTVACFAPLTYANPASWKATAGLVTLAVGSLASECGVE